MTDARSHASPEWLDAVPILLNHCSIKGDLKLVCTLLKTDKKTSAAVHECLEGQLQLSCSDPLTLQAFEQILPWLRRHALLLSHLACTQPGFYGARRSNPLLLPTNPTQTQKLDLEKFQAATAGLARALLQATTANSASGEQQEQQQLIRRPAAPHDGGLMLQSFSTQTPCIQILQLLPLGQLTSLQLESYCFCVASVGEVQHIEQRIQQRAQAAGLQVIAALSQLTALRRLHLPLCTAAGYTESLHLDFVGIAELLVPSLAQLSNLTHLTLNNRSCQDLSELWSHLPSHLLELTLTACEDDDGEEEQPKSGFQPLKLRHLTALTSLNVLMDRQLYRYPGKVATLDVTIGDELPPNLANLAVYDCHSAEVLSGLCQLTYLAIASACYFTDLLGLAHLTSLKDLDLGYRRPVWPDEHDGQVAQTASEVAHMWPSLHNLLRHLEIHDEYYSVGAPLSILAVENLGQLTGLTSLDLSMCPIGATFSQFARSLSKLRNLLELDIMHVQFLHPLANDNALPVVNWMQRIELDEATADGVRSLARALASCRKLRRLNIYDLYPVGARAVFGDAATILTVLTGLTYLRYDGGPP